MKLLLLLEMARVDTDCPIVLPIPNPGGWRGHGHLLFADVADLEQIM